MDVRNAVPVVAGIALAFTSACTSAIQVHHFGQTAIDPSQRAFVMLEPTDWETSLRIALDEQKFTVRKFESTSSIRQTRTVDSAGARFESETSFNQAGARYGLTLTQRKQVDFCPWNSNINATFLLEVTDLKSNEVIMVIERGNWTGLCGPFSARSRYLFDELADELAKEWKR